MTDADTLIPEEMKEKFDLFLLFIEQNGPGPEPSTDAPSISPRQAAELGMFYLFLKERQVPTALRKRIMRRYIEEVLIKGRGPGIRTWVFRFFSVSVLVTAIGSWRSSPEEFPGYMVLIALLFSAMFFWSGEKLKEPGFEIWLFRLYSGLIFVAGIALWWYSPKEIPGYMAPVVVLAGALCFLYGEIAKKR